MALIGKNPELNHHQGFAMLYHWLLSGGKTAFLQDANSLIMKTDQLVEVLGYLRRTFPSIVGSPPMRDPKPWCKNPSMTSRPFAGPDWTGCMWDWKAGMMRC
jgi:hypothetical protein